MKHDFFAANQMSSMRPLGLVGQAVRPVPGWLNPREPCLTSRGGPTWAHAAHVMQVWTLCHVCVPMKPCSAANRCLISDRIAAMYY